MQNVKTIGLSSEKSFEEKLDYCLQKSRLPYNISTEEARFNTMDRIKSSASSSEKFGASMFLKVAAGMLVIILGSVLAYYFMGMSVIENKSTRSAEYTLPDGSVVKLSNRAAAYYNSSIWFMNRKINLVSGEAFFEVSPGQKFTVETKMGDITVLGTSFNVNVNDDNLKVACKTGSVKVSMPGIEAPILLSAGKGLDYAISLNEIMDVDLNKIGAWTDSIYNFNDAEVTDVFETLEGETGFAFVISDSIHSKYSGQINKNLAIEDILEIVCIPSGLDYSVDADAKKIYITKIQ